ncbi:DUF1835 domain-containing protein [Oceanicoccus sagamiensis]|uniref:DUF1835 domain-containing protein n=1 Tax=Oceanicoccus sagamiensis TaxID=716816 RepID=A0A1X9NCW0_9GAMM|nr:DUF1835 domain-containing protein [Oceanicoccus sagamiensis]ARN73359.1 hypothetical protein BST96_04090 [Oceanicoccus sagamiensis]
MTDNSTRGNTPFRLNLEQQKKRAKELLRAYQENKAEAFARFKQSHPQYTNEQADTAPRLADAQLVIARELGVASWTKLKQHIDEMSNNQRLIKTQQIAPDSDLTTLHIRCGTDIENTLKEAGFSGAFLDYKDPVCQGPVVKSDQYHQIRAEFIAKVYGDLVNLSYEEIYQDSLAEQQSIQTLANHYQRVVLWFEHDTFDQLLLIKLLAELAKYPQPAVLEIVSPNQFPGTARFIGLGQLPPEAIYLLWSKRETITNAQLQLGTEAWDALCQDSPEQLAVLMKQPHCQQLPHLPAAIHRHLQELPATDNGLGLTEQLTLEILKQQARPCGQLFKALMTVYEPLPWLGDLMFWHIVKGLAEGDEPLVLIQENNEQHWPNYHAVLSEQGLAVLKGESDYLSFRPDAYWLGGVEIKPKAANWRWDKKTAQPRWGFSA